MGPTPSFLCSVLESSGASNWVRRKEDVLYAACALEN